MFPYFKAVTDKFTCILQYCFRKHVQSTRVRSCTQSWFVFFLVAVAVAVLRRSCWRLMFTNFKKPTQVLGRKLGLTDFFFSSTTLLFSAFSGGQMLMTLVCFLLLFANINNNVLTSNHKTIIFILFNYIIQEGLESEINLAE